MPGGVGIWDRGIEEEQGGQQGWTVGSTVGRGEGRLQLVFCCSRGDESGALVVEEQREESRPVGSFLVFLASMSYGFTGCMC